MKKYSYKVVGVSFPARDGSSRQETLKELFYDDIENDVYSLGHKITFEGYDYKGDDALAVFVDNKEIGNISANKVQEVADIAKKAPRCTITLSVNGHNTDEYEYIVDRYRNKKDWKESDPYFDAEEADEEYKELMEELKENEIYSAVVHFLIPEEGDDLKEKIEEKTNTKKEPSKGLITFGMIISVVLILMSLVLLLASPIAGIIGIIIGVFVFVYYRKKSKELKENINKDNKRE